MGMVPNANFLRVMEINFEHDSPLILGCQSGARSARAAEAMLAAGFSAVHNVTGGFGGARDDSGAILQKGGLISACQSITAIRKIGTTLP